MSVEDRVRRVLAEAVADEPPLRGAPLEHAHRHRRRRLVLAGAVAMVLVLAAVAVAAAVRSREHPLPSTSPTKGWKTITVNGVPFTVSGSASPDGPCIGVAAPGGSLRGGCKPAAGSFRAGAGRLRVKGQLYHIAYGQAPPGAARMEIIMGDGSTKAADTTSGLWLVVVATTGGDRSGDFTTVTAQDGRGNVLAQVALPSLAAEERRARQQGHVPSPAPGPFGLGSNITVRPDHGPVGTRVHLAGGGFTGASWQEVARTHGGAYGVFLDVDPGTAGGCELLAGGPFTLRISPSGVLAADFTVPAQGSCFQTHPTKVEPVRPGRYAIGVGCHVCLVAYFRVTGG